jgi:colanic acid/amylovoran biosynthesis protein
MKFYVEIYLDHNLGDDLFLDCLLSRYPEHDFYVGVNSNFGELNIAFSKYENLHVNKLISLKNFKKLKEFDAYILIGGSIYMDLNIAFSKLWISRYVKSKFCRINKIPFFVLGCNLGPFKTKFGKNIIKYHLDNVTDICVRDRNSYDILNNWDIKARFNLAPDIVFSYDPFHDLIKSDENLIGISIINTKFHSEHQLNYINKMVEIVNCYHEKNNVGVVRLLGFDGGLENDGHVIEKILAKVIHKNRVEVCNYSQKFELKSFLKKILECEFLICTRFHAMILALKHDKRSFVISYSKKISYVLEDLSYPYDYINYQDIDNLNVDKLIDSIHCMPNSYKFMLNSDYLEDSKLHFFSMDRLINENKNDY